MQVAAIICGLFPADPARSRFFAQMLELSGCEQNSKMGGPLYAM
jgi:hypothetical protein